MDGRGPSGTWGQTHIWGYSTIAQLGVSQSAISRGAVRIATATAALHVIVVHSDQNLAEGLVDDSSVWLSGGVCLFF